MLGDMTIVIVLAILFFVVANPVTYKAVDQLLSSVGLAGMIFGEAGSVSQCGVLIHTVVFAALYIVYQRFVAPMVGETNDSEEGFMEHIEMSDDQGDDVPNVATPVPSAEDIDYSELPTEEEPVDVDMPDSDEYKYMASPDDSKVDEGPEDPSYREPTARPGPEVETPTQQPSDDIAGFEGFSSGMGASF